MSSTRCATQDTVVARELDESRREAELIERLRSIYRGQGIEVPDEVIRQGVAAIKENRFVYTPPAPGLGVTLAKVWIARRRIGKAAGAAAVAPRWLWAAGGSPMSSRAGRRRSGSSES